MGLPRPRAFPHSGEGAAAQGAGPAPRMVGEERQVWKETGLSAHQFAALYREAAPSLYRYFWFHLGSRAESEDLVSETFLGALRSLGTYRPERGSTGAWLFGIARHVLAQHRKAECRARYVETDARLGLQNAQSAVSQLEERIDLWQAVRELMPQAREALALKFGAEFSNVEIAEIMGLPEAQVGMLLYRALVRLRDRLGGRTRAR